MYHANDNATDKIVSFHIKNMESILTDPVALLSEDIQMDIYSILDTEGYNMGEMETLRDLAVIGEMLKAMMYRQNGHYHTYQDFLDQVTIAHDPTEI